MLTGRRLHKYLVCLITPASAGFIHLRIMSLLALVLVEPLHHSCHLISLSLLEFSNSPLCSALRGSRFRSQHKGNGSCGGISRSLLGGLNPVGGVDELEHAAINNTLSGVIIFNFFTIDNLFLDHFGGADLSLLLLFLCKL